MKHTVHSVALDSGAKVFVIDAPDSHMVDLRIHFEAGFQNFDKDTFHVPHLLEHLLVGSGGRFESEEAMLRALQTLGAQCNATTDFQHVTVLMQVPAINFLQALEILLGAVFRDSQLTQEMLEKEREIVLREIVEQHDSLGSQQVGTLLSDSFENLVPNNWEYHLERVQAIDLATVQAAYDEYITLANAKIMVAGALTKTMQQSMLKQLKDIPVAARHDKAKSNKLQLSSNTPHIHGVPIDLDDNASLIFAFTSPVDNAEPHAQRVSYNFAAQLLFGAPTAVIPLKLRASGYVYSVTLDSVMLDDWFVAIVHVSTDNDKAHLAALEILKRLRLYGAGYIEDDELESVRQYALNILPGMTETVGDLNEWYAGDVLRGRQLTSVEDEKAVLKQLSKQDVARAVRVLFLDAQKTGVISCKDAPYWFDVLNDVNDKAADEEDAESIQSQFDTFRQALQAKRTAAPQREGFMWGMYWLLMFFSWITALWASHLPVKGTNGTVSVFDFAWDTNPLWGVCFFLPFTIAGILTWVQGKRTNIAEQVAIILNFVAAAVYAYGIYRYFGDIGVDNQPWYEDAASVIQPVFFYIAAPIAFVAVIAQQLRSLKAKKKARQVTAGVGNI